MPKRLVSVLQSARDSGVTAAIHSLPRETGGILAGWRTSDGIHVVEMLEVRSRWATRSSYVRSQGKANFALDAYVKNLPSGSSVGYVGDWHTHPEQQTASQTDLDSIKEFARNDRQPVALIVLSRNGKHWDLNAWSACHVRGRTVFVEQVTSVIVANPLVLDPLLDSAPPIGTTFWAGLLYRKILSSLMAIAKLHWFSK